MHDASRLCSERSAVRLLCCQCTRRSERNGLNASLTDADAEGGTVTCGARGPRPGSRTSGSRSRSRREARSARGTGRGHCVAPVARTHSAADIEATQRNATLRFASHRTTTSLGAAISLLVRIAVLSALDSRCFYHTRHPAPRPSPAHSDPPSTRLPLPLSPLARATLSTRPLFLTPDTP